MSLFGKMKAGLKNVTNKVTGGYGELSVEFDKETYLPGETVTATITVVAKAELKITNIKAWAEGYETANYKDNEYGRYVRNGYRRERFERGDYDRERFDRDEWDDRDNWDERDGHQVDRDDRRRFERGRLRAAQAACGWSDYTLKDEQEVCGEMVMEEGETKTFQYQIALPEDLPPTYDGDHLNNKYCVRVQVDIPWGVDLRENKQFNVVTNAGACEPIQAQQQSLRCKVTLSIPQPAVQPGDKVGYELKLQPSEPVGIDRISVELLSLEVMAGQVGLPSYDQPRQDDDEEGSSQPQRLDWEDEELRIIVDGVQQLFMEDEHLSEEFVIKETIELPEDFGPSYRRGEMSHRILMVVKVYVDDPRPLEFKQEITVCEGSIAAPQGQASVPYPPPAAYPPPAEGAMYSGYPPKAGDPPQAGSLPAAEEVGPMLPTVPTQIQWGIPQVQRAKTAEGYRDYSVFGTVTYLSKDPNHRPARTDRQGVERIIMMRTSQMAASMVRLTQDEAELRGIEANIKAELSEILVKPIEILAVQVVVEPR